MDDEDKPFEQPVQPQQPAEPPEPPPNRDIIEANPQEWAEAPIRRTGESSARG